MSSSTASFNVTQTLVRNGTTTDISFTSSGLETEQVVNNQTITLSYNLSFTTLTNTTGNTTTTILNDQSASIESLANPIPEYPFGDDYFINVVMNSYMDILIANSEVVPLAIDATVKYMGDFYGILNDMGINPKYFPIILRMNGFSDTGLYNTDITSIIIPDSSFIDSIANSYSNTVANPL